ncbi:hypothetical protein ACYZUA_17170 [Pseudomonas sp. LS2P72]
MSERSGGALPWVIGFITVGLVIFSMGTTLANLVRLDAGTMFLVVWYLGGIWGIAWMMGLLAFPLNYTWPVCLGLSWLALMPALRVWFSEDIYAFLDPLWARFVGVAVITFISSRIKSLVE